MNLACIGIASPFLGMVLIVFWKRALHIFLRFYILALLKKSYQNVTALTHGDLQQDLATVDPTFLITVSIECTRLPFWEIVGLSPKHAGLNPGQVKPMTLKLILVNS